MLLMRRPLVLLVAVLGLLAAVPAAASGSPRARLHASLARALRSAGGASGAYVLDLTTGQALFSASPRTLRLPASVEKLYTTSTALARFGPAARLTTNVLGVGSVGPNGTFTGTLYLRGGGDPTFGSANYDRSYYGTGATMRALVRNLVHATGITAIRGRIVGDETIFDARRGTPATGFQASAYVEGLLSGLAYDRGYTNASNSSFQSRPALFAAQQFASALKNSGVRVPRSTPIYTAGTPSGAQPLASVRSPRMATLVRLTNAPSDNFFAEMLLKGLGAGFGGAGSTAAGAAVVRHQIASSFGLHPRLNDGSGLSRRDRTSPLQVVTLLRMQAGNSAFTNSLAVAGVSGTMRYEDQGTAAAGNCRGKTGSLHDVANMVGYCTAKDGHQLAFAFLMNSVDPVSGHAIEDRMAVTLAKFNG